ncbi:helix-turn-helix transcriptional regulator [Cohnella sp. JJ-181]|uniref:helix-turn-helix transcriptional regulator n=1 Tax=Cohnella rhizoplanae TaxID=2974897 RepID=UPI0022FF8F09|nr:AraC family transcriptional regulator [Cohnella sp. JJ-181]CAI6083831.1 HTH-type transcriptional activator RhaR [Cohnella sp. JJ-181]
MPKRQADPHRWVLNPEREAGREAVASPAPAELVQLGRQRYAEAYPIASHRHEGAYEFVYVERGAVTWEVGGSLYPTLAGQWFYANPGELHSARFDHMEPSRIWWLILADPGARPSWLRLTEDERSWVSGRLSGLPRVFSDAGRACEQLTELKTALESGDPAGALIARHGLLDIVLGFFREPAAPSDSALREAIRRSVAAAAARPERRVTVAEMASAVHLSESHYFKLFRELFGLSPAVYLDRARMERACQLLRAGRSVTDAAYELGYKTSQHFATSFKKTIGRSPQQWRADDGKARGNCVGRSQELRRGDD